METALLIAERDALAAERDEIIADGRSSRRRKQRTNTDGPEQRWSGGRSILARLEQQAFRPQDRLATLERQLQEIYKSHSWRITAPLRKLMTWLRHLRLFG
jgi:hypothetical protein